MHQQVDLAHEQVDNEIPLGKRRPLYRLFEMVPAIISYGALLATIVLPLINPRYGAYYVITIVGITFVRGVRGAFDLAHGYSRYKRAARVDWAARLMDIALTLDGKRVPPSPPASFKVDKHRELLARVKGNPQDFPHPSDLKHAIIIASYNESYEVIAPTIRGLCYATTPGEQLYIFMAFEERGGAEMERTAERLKEEYGHRFAAFELVKHPRDLPDEIAGKGANITYAGHRVQEWADGHGYPYSDILVTTLDCDNKPYDSYFDYAAYAYIKDPDRKHRAYQPIALYLSNIWDAPALTRVIANANCVWNLTSTVRPYTLRNFASHTQPLDALVEMDFWTKRSIVEDGHQYWRSWFHFHGDYKVTPIHVPIYQDAVLAGGLKQTAIAQFKQLSRWSYGASDVAFVAQNMADKRAPFWRSLIRFLSLLEGHVTVASCAIIIAWGGWIPVAMMLSSGQSDALVKNTPVIMGVIQQVALISLLVSIIVVWNLIPPRPARYSRFRHFMMLAQWVIYPMTMIFYNAFCYIYSQGRLLLGMYRQRFDVTEKTAVSEPQRDNVLRSSGFPFDRV